jgi:hypothetical protein
MILNLLFKMKETDLGLKINVVKGKEAIIEDIISNNLFLFWNKEYLIIELENKIILKNKVTENKYEFKKGKKISNNKFHKKMLKANNENKNNS